MRLVCATILAATSVLSATVGHAQSASDDLSPFQRHVLEKCGAELAAVDETFPSLEEVSRLRAEKGLEPREAVRESALSYFKLEETDTQSDGLEKIPAEIAVQEMSWLASAAAFSEVYTKVVFEMSSGRLPSPQALRSLQAHADLVHCTEPQERSDYPAFTKAYDDITGACMLRISHEIINSLSDGGASVQDDPHAFIKDLFARYRNAGAEVCNAP